MSELTNESQPVCPRCGAPCDCALPLDWEELRRDAEALLAAAVPLCEAAEERRNQTLLSMPSATDALQ